MTPTFLRDTFYIYDNMNLTQFLTNIVAITSSLMSYIVVIIFLINIVTNISGKIIVTIACNNCGIVVVTNVRTIVSNYVVTINEGIMTTPTVMIIIFCVQKVVTH